MNQKIIVLGLCLITSSTHAACDGGQIITGLENQLSFCYSDRVMNWWSAFSWCRANGGHLATFAEACPNQVLKDWIDCTNLKGINVPGSGWTSTPYGNNRAYVVYPSHGGTRCANRKEGYNYDGHALCVPD